MYSSKFELRLCAVLALALSVSAPAIADHRPKHGSGGGGGDGDGGGSVTSPFSYGAPGTTVTGTLYNWMHPDFVSAWGHGYGGQGTTITFVDDFNSSYTFQMSLKNENCSTAGACASETHGYWTALQGKLLAPLATIAQDDFAVSGNVSLASGFNALNLSYGMYAQPGLRRIIWGPQERSIIDYASKGSAVIAKAAGNGCGAATGQSADLCGGTEGSLDYLARDLIGKPGTIFVGALNDHGTPANQQTMAWYSNVAGTNATVQNQFLVVGVDMRDIYQGGTSFAAPQVAAGAAILSSKFPTASPSQVASRLLTTARTDTITSYQRATHGMGEMSLGNALAPDKIN
jgi:hypothetical protein